MKKLAVVGQPIGHSRSPAMHRAAFTALGMDGWSYEAIEVPPDRFDERMQELAATGFVGVNVTVPHKSAALSVADEISEVAREIGAANTLSFEDGRIRAHNTDAEGFLRSLPAPARENRALVLGAGGAARAVVWGLVREAAEVEVWNRTGLSSRNLATEMGGKAVEAPDVSSYELVVNATSVGLGGEDPEAELPIAAGFRAGQTVVDLVYGDEPSRLLVRAGADGADTVDGREVLVQQGALSFRLWTGREAPLEAMRAAVRI